MIMSTSSIFTNIRIVNTTEAEKFVEILDSTFQDSHQNSAPSNISQLTDLDIIRKIMTQNRNIKINQR